MAKPPWQKQQEHRDRVKNGVGQITTFYPLEFKYLLEDVVTGKNRDPQERTLEERLSEYKDLIEMTLRGVVFHITVKGEQYSLDRHTFRQMLNQAYREIA